MFRLTDEVIAEIAKLVQLAIVTGTDVVDNMRMIRVEPDEDNSGVVLTSDYKEHSEIQIEKLLSEVEEMSKNKDTDTIEVS